MLITIKLILKNIFKKRTFYFTFYILNIFIQAKITQNSLVKFYCLR